MGNVLSVISNLKRGTAVSGGQITEYEAVIVSQTDYYPFGMEIASRTVIHEEYRFSFNGKEKSGEITGGKLDFGARIYDARIGKWLSVDPVTHEWQSPYTGIDNNPIVKVDPDGKTAVVTIENGKVIVSANFNFLWERYR